MLYKCEINFFILNKHKGLIKELRRQGVTNDDMAIWSYIYYCCFDNRSSLSRIKYRNQYYTWISHALILDSNPLLGKMREVEGKRTWTPWSKQTVIRSINRLIDAGLLFRHTECKKVYKSKDSIEKTFYTIPREIVELFKKYEK